MWREGKVGAGEGLHVVQKGVDEFLRHIGVSAEAAVVAVRYGVLDYECSARDYRLYRGV